MLYITIGVVLAVASLAGLLIWQSRRAAKAELAAEINHAALNNATKAQQIDESVARLSDPALDDELYRRN